MIFTPSELQSIKLKSRRDENPKTSKKQTSNQSRRDDIIPSPLHLNQKHILVYNQHKIALKIPNTLDEKTS